MSVNLEDIEGVGPTMANKLRKADINSVLDLSCASPVELLSAGVVAKRESAEELIESARQLLNDNAIIDNDYITGSQDLVKRESLKRITTGSKALDNLLGAGIETRAITEFYGQFGSGKSQICFTLCTTAQSAYPEKPGVIYIDTEGTFRSDRIKQICEARELDVKAILDNIHSIKVHSADKLEAVVKSLPAAIEKFNAGVVIVDSITNLHRADFLGRGTLAERQQRLSLVVHKLVRVAENYNVAVVITNQVQSSPDQFFGDPTKPVGGNVIGHTSTYRVKLFPKGATKGATMIDSPCHPYESCEYNVTAAGVVDVEEDKPKKKSALAQEEGDQ